MFPYDRSHELRARRRSRGRKEVVVKGTLSSRRNWDENKRMVRPL